MFLKILILRFHSLPIVGPSHTALLFWGSLLLCQVQNLAHTDLKPILDVPGRWMSTVDMLTRALELKDGLISFFVSYDSSKKSTDYPISLQPGCWAAFERILQYLVSFKKYTVSVCGDTYPTLSLVAPMYNKLLGHLQAWMEMKTKPGEPLHNSIVAAKAKITNYFNLTSDAFTICTVLDPRLGFKYYKGQGDTNQEEVDTIYATVNAVYQIYYAPVTLNMTAAIEQEDDEFAIFPKPKPHHDELKSYMDYPDLLDDGDTKDILTWWRRKAKAFPNLSNMARDYLAIPGTSTTSERLFSTGKYLVSDSRCSLRAETIQACQCLKSWIKYPSNT